MIRKTLTTLSAAAIALTAVSCAPRQDDAYDTGNLYGYPDPAYPDAPDGGSLYDQPPAYDDGGVGPADPAPSSTTHTVVRGDSLYKISREYNVRMQSIIDANGIKNPNLLVVGQKLTIPAR